MEVVLRLWKSYESYKGEKKKQGKRIHGIKGMFFGTRRGMSVYKYINKGTK